MQVEESPQQGAVAHSLTEVARSVNDQEPSTLTIFDQQFKIALYSGFENIFDRLPFERC